MGLLLPIVIIGLWQILSALGLIRPEALPSPYTVGVTVIDLFRHGRLLEHIAVTGGRVLSGFAIGAAAGTVAGALTGYFPRVRQLAAPLLQALSNIPSMAWVPLFLLWLGIFEASKVALIATGVFFPVYLIFASAIEQVDGKLIEVGQIYGFSPREQILRIILPAALPSWITALRSGLSLGWMFVVAAELMGAAKGLGFLMYDAQQTSRADVIIGSIVLFALLGKLTDSILYGAGRLLIRPARAA